MAIGEAEERIEGAGRLDMAARATLFVLGAIILTVAAALGAAVLAERAEGVAFGGRVSDRIAFALAEEASPMIGAPNADYAASLRRVAAAPHIAQVLVLDRGGAVLAALKPATADLRREATAAASAGMTTFRTGAGDLAAVRPVLRAGRIVGRAVVVLSRESYAHERLKVLGPIAVALFGFLLAIAPITYFLARRLAAPLRALTVFAKEIDGARLGQRIEVQSGDEFETLARAFNRMMRRMELSMEQIQRLAFADTDTGLPNRERLLRELDLCIARGAGAQASSALIVFEFDRLKRFKETLDEEAALTLTQLVARRLAQATRAADRAVRVQTAAERPSLVAALRPDEFAVLTPDIADPAQATRLAQLIIGALSQPLAWREHKIDLGAACGVAIAPRDGKDGASVLRHAVLARTAAKTGGGLHLKVFTEALDRQAAHRVDFEREMRAALERREFHAYFQPKINLATGEIESAEALARWVRPDGAMIGPARFIPAAEENGLIGPVSDAVMREACWKAAGWAREGMPIHVAVNVSALQLNSSKFPDHVLRILEHAGLSPQFLELEITESLAMQDPDRTMRLIEPLRRQGVRFAIDDFGCGHSSLAALSKLPFDVIKIDQQFIRGLERGERNAPAIVDTILAMARALDLVVVAEGVERREEAEFLSSRGCRYAQGFLFGAAAPPAEFREMLRRGRANMSGAAGAA